MSFELEALALIAPLAALAVAALLARGDRRPGFASDNVRRLWTQRGRVSRARSAGAGWVGRRGPLLPLCVGLVLCALARPRCGDVEQVQRESPREVVIALDLSRSMGAADVRPTRLARAKLLVDSLLDELSGERVALVAFAGTAFVQFPLSADREVLSELLAGLDTAALPTPGSDVGAALDASLEAWPEDPRDLYDPEPERTLVLLSDGEAHADDWRARIPALVARGVRIVALGVGTPEGARVPGAAPEEWLVDEAGKVVVSRLESGPLRALAEATGGVYRPAATWVDLPALVASLARPVRGGRRVDGPGRAAEGFQWLLAPAAAALALALWLELPVAPRRRKLSSSPSASGLATGAALLALVPILGEAAREEVVALGDSRQPSALERIVADLSQRPALSAADYAELAAETVSFATSARSAPDGVFADALAAVDLGERLDESAADWPALRRRLEALRARRSDEGPSTAMERSKPTGGQDSGQGEGGEAGAPAGEHGGDGERGTSGEERTNSGGEDSGESEAAAPDDGGSEDAREADRGGSPSGQQAQSGASGPPGEQGRPGAQGSSSAEGDPGSRAGADGAAGRRAQETARDRGPGGDRSDSDEGRAESASAGGDAGTDTESPPPTPSGDSHPQERSTVERDAPAGAPSDALGGAGGTASAELQEVLAGVAAVRAADAPARLFERMNAAEGRARSARGGKPW